MKTASRQGAKVPRTGAERSGSLRRKNRLDAAEKDVVYTPAWLVDLMLSHLPLSGSVLDPCAGRGAFRDKIPGCMSCEIAEGADFFDWREPVSWVVGNPPYAIFTKFTRHAMSVADNIAWLIPMNKPFCSEGFARDLWGWGAPVLSAFLGTGNQVGFPFGFPLGFYWFKKGHTGKTEWLDLRAEARRMKVEV